MIADHLQITSTISTLELIWTVVSALGFIFLMSVCSKAVTDKLWLDREKANGNLDLRQYVAITSILIAAGGVITQAAFLATGIIAMTQPNLGNAPYPHTAQVVISGLFILSSLTNTVLAAFIYYRRTAIVGMVEERLQH